MKAIYRKQFLPNYGVFDEDRYFQPGRGLVLLRCGDTLVGPTVCEDIWQPGPPATDLALAGAHVVANISASPFHVGKGAEREEMLAAPRDNSCWIVLVNAVGAQDELIFDGQSLVLDENGEVVVRGPAFEEALLLVDVDATTAVTRRLRDARRRSRARAETCPRPRSSMCPSATRSPRAAFALSWPSRWASSRRCASPSSSACATTQRRTVSRTSSSASRAGSTRR